MYPIANTFPTSGISPKHLDTKVKSMISNRRLTAFTSHAIGLASAVPELGADMGDEVG
jgi:hypothetical protein